MSSISSFSSSFLVMTGWPVSNLIEMFPKLVLLGGRLFHSHFQQQGLSLFIKMRRTEVKEIREKITVKAAPIEVRKFKIFSFWSSEEFSTVY